MYKIVIAGMRKLDDFTPKELKDKKDGYLEDEETLETLFGVLDDAIAFIREYLARIEEKPDDGKIEIVSGCAAGADKLGELYAESRGLALKLFPAEWESWDGIEESKRVIKTNQFGRKYNPAAGIIRNTRMGDYADAVIAIWDRQSKGTGHMVGYAKGLSKLVYILDYKNTASRLAMSRIMNKKKRKGS